MTTSSLNIIDLAGSERSKNNALDRLAEAGSINRSLMVLGQCIEVLKKNQHTPKHDSTATTSAPGSTATTGRGVVPFRQNKLTELLFGNVMKGSKCVMIVTLNMGTSFEENVGVLRYASLAHEIEALPASELGRVVSQSSMSRSGSGDVRSDGMETPFCPRCVFGCCYSTPVVSPLAFFR